MALVSVRASSILTCRLAHLGLLQTRILARFEISQIRKDTFLELFDHERLDRSSKCLETECQSSNWQKEGSESDDRYWRRFGCDARLTDVRPGDHVQPVPVSTTDVFAVGKQEPIQGRVGTGDERDGFAVRAMMKVVPRILLGIWVLWIARSTSVS